MSSISRRRFITHTALAGGFLASGSAPLLPQPLLGAAASPRPKVNPVVGCQLYGWGQYYEREGKNLDAHLDEVLSALRDSGYDYAEGTLDTHTPDNTARFAERLKRKGLVPVSLYTGGSFHTAEAAPKTTERILAAAKVAHAAGFRVLVCNPDPIGRDKTDEELKTQVAALNTLGEELRRLGMEFGIHHHTPEMRREAKEFHYNFQNSPAGTVDFCFDVHWVYRGGLHPAKALELYHHRIVSWHLRQSRNQIWWEDLDSGDIDYPEIRRWVDNKSIPRRYTVELALEGGTKITRSSVENHRRSRDFVRQVLGA
jgi:inosose dehydratase